jgi:hypothetical protein
MAPPVAPTPQLALCLLAGFLATTAGTARAALFARPFVRSRAAAVLGVTVAALLTVPLGPLRVVARRAHAVAVDDPRSHGDREVRWWSSSKP